MMPPYSCCTPGRKPGTSTNVTSEMLNALQKRMNRLDLIDALMSIAPGEDRRLVGDDADRPAQDPAEADDDVGGVAGLDLQEVAPVDDPADHVAHVVALLGLDGHDLGQLGVGVDVVVVGELGEDLRGCSRAGS